MLYIENPKDTTRKLLALINEYSKVTYKINIQKLLAFLYTNNEQSEKEIKETIPLTIATKRIQFLGVDFQFKMAEQDLHSPPARAPKSQPSTGGHWNLPKKKRYPTSIDKEEATARWQEGHNHNKIKSYTRRVGESQTGEQ